MNEHTKKALSATKNLHKRLREWEEREAESDSPPSVDYTELKKLAADANKAVQAMQRHASDDAVRANVRENILREAVRDELIDREANAARILEKQRAFFEGKDAGTLKALERVNQTVANVEASIASLCPHQLQRAAGVSVLAEEAAGVQ
tara:strand:+ start:2001 stop:2447 length:447 start_codon:yes stop_codon:yes gene_type:complete